MYKNTKIQGVRFERLETQSQKIRKKKIERF